MLTQISKGSTEYPTLNLSERANDVLRNMQGYFDVESTVDADPSPNGGTSEANRDNNQAYKASTVELDEESMFGFAHADDIDLLQQQRKTSKVMLALQQLGITLSCAVQEVTQPSSYGATFIADADALLKQAKQNGLVNKSVAELPQDNSEGSSLNQLTLPTIPTQVSCID